MCLIPRLRRFPWRRKWLPSSVFLPGKSHGQRSWLATIHGVTKESDTSYWLNNNNKSFQSIVFALFWLNLFLSNLFIWHYCKCFLYFIFGLFIASVSESHSAMSNSLQPHGIVHGILQARILEWVAIPFSRWSSQPRDRIQVSCIAGRLFTSWATREASV